MFCVKCGKELAPGTKFCQNCGNPVPQVNNINNGGDNSAEKKVAPVFAHTTPGEDKADVFAVPVKTPAPAKEEKKNVMSVPTETPAPAKEDNRTVMAVPVETNTQDNMNDIPVMEQPVNIVIPPNYEKKKSGVGVVILSAIITLLVLLVATGAGYVAFSQLRGPEIIEEDGEKESKKNKKDSNSEEDAENTDSEDKGELGEDKTTEADENGDNNTEVVADNNGTENATTEAVEQTVEAEPSPKAIEVVKTVLYTVRVNALDGYANFRSTPEKSDNILREIYVGELIDIYGEEGQWLEAEYDGSTGWVHSTQVTAVEVYDNGEEYKALCPWSSIERITDKRTVNILQKNADDIYQLRYPTSRTFEQMIINEIYARHGYMFKDDELQDYFSSQPWYAPVTNDMNSIGKTLNQVEKDNVKFLQ